MSKLMMLVAAKWREFSARDQQNGDANHDDDENEDDDDQDEQEQEQDEDEDDERQSTPVIS